MKRYIRSAKEAAVPEELAIRPYRFMIHTGNPTYADDILRVANERFGAILVHYYYMKDSRIYGPETAYAIGSKEDAQVMFDYCKEHFPVQEKKLYLYPPFDWSTAYQISVDDYYKGYKKLRYHSTFPKNR